MAFVKSVENSFRWRRWHSLTGLWLALFLFEHLLTNSQAALWIGSDGEGFIHAVNAIQSLPYLKVIELTLIALPILVHLIWGVRYLFTAEYNVLPGDGSRPALTHFGGNHAYTWQRITAWVLLFALLGHVVQMRFLNYPHSVKVGDATLYVTPVTLDSGLYTLSERLGVTLYDTEKVKMREDELYQKQISQVSLRDADVAVQQAVIRQEEGQHHAFFELLKRYELGGGRGVAVAGNFGTAELLVVRETFKEPLMLLLYTLFVLSAVFHAYNGLWTFMITWGVTVSVRSQRAMRRLTAALMLLVGFLGLAAIWGSYLVNLTH